LIGLQAEPALLETPATLYASCGCAGCAVVKLPVTPLSEPSHVSSDPSVVTFSPEEAAAAIEGLIDPIPYDPDFGWGRPEPVWFERPQPGAALAWEAIWLGLDALESNPNAPQAQISGPDIPGGSITSATLTLGGSANGTIGTVGDTDWYRVELTAGVSYNFTLNGLGPTALSDPYLELYSSAGALVSLDDDTGPGLNSLLRFTPTQSGTYYINARAFDTETGNYTIAFNTGPAQNPLDTINLGFTLVSSNVTYYFAQTGDTYVAGGTQTASRSWTATEQDAARTAFATYAAVSGLTFTEVSSQSAARFVMMITELDGNVLGRFFSGANGGLGQFDPAGSGWTTNGLQPGGLGFVTLIHEIGHGLGLAHPHDAGGGSEVMQGVVDEFNSLGTFLLNQGVFTTMTYNDGWQSAPHGPTPSSSFGVQSTPMALDIASIQQRYGVNTNTNTGNNDYVLPTSSGVGVGYRAIWDADGTDTISHNGSASATIDLRPATLQTAFGGGGYVSFVNGIHGGFTIAANVVIENAIGGSGADTIIGNETANRLEGNGGADQLTGFGGNDTLVGGAGADLIDGGAGLDYASYDTESSAIVVDLSNTANNTGDAFGDTYASIEGVIGGSGGDTLRGDSLANALRGLGGNDTIDGAGGRDTAEYTLASTGATWNRNTNGTWTVNAGTQGADSLTNVEFLSFTDRTVFLDRAFRTFSGDGTSNVLFRRNDGIVATWEVNGTSITNAVFLPSAGNEWTIRGTGDIDADGDDDVIWQRTDGLVYSWSMQAGTFASSNAITGVGLDWTLLGVGDFNGDSRDDLVWRRSDGTVFTWHMSGASIASAQAITGLGSEWSLAGVGDMNSDGRDDMVWRRADTGQTVIWQMNGAAIQASGSTSQAFGTEWQIAGVGDVNGDGYDDLVMRRGSDGMVAVATMNGSTVLGFSNIAAVATDQWAIQQVGDYNGDGRDDILWRNLVDNVIFVWNLDGTNIQSAGGLSGIGTEWGVI
jgi:hypothetical protein